MQIKRQVGRQEGHAALQNQTTNHHEATKSNLSVKESEEQIYNVRIRVI